MKKFLSVVIATIMLFTIVCVTIGCTATSQGEKGDTGKSAYEVWLDVGNTGTETDFINWLKGKDGAPGANGQDGKDGAPGTNGEDGKDGASGANGEDGKDGAPGTNGQDGKDGAPGANGEDGKDGPGTNGEDGKDGQSAYQIYKKYNSDYPGTEEQWINGLVSGTLYRHTVTFRADGSDIVKTVFHGFNLTDFPPVPENPGYSGYWSGSFTNITYDFYSSPNYIEMDTMAAISITTESGEDVWEKEYYNSTVNVVDLDGQADVLYMPAEVKVRGNHSAELDKKPFRIKFNKKQSMLGLNDGQKYKSWVLLALYKDLSMMRDASMFYYSQQVFKANGYYSADFKFVEVYVNDEYRGVYLLTEQQQVNKGRVNLPEADEKDPEATDIGYLIEYDGLYGYEDLGERFTLNHSTLKPERITGETANVNVSGYAIKSDIYSEVQRSFIQNYTQNVYNIVHNAVYSNVYYEFNSDYSGVVNVTDTTARATVEKVLDIDSYVEMYIQQEIAIDPDLPWSSFFMSVDMSVTGNKLLTFEAPWDFDITMGIYAEDTDILFAAGEVAKKTNIPITKNFVNAWTTLLSGQDWFWQKVSARWQEIRSANILENTLQFIEDVTTTHAAAFARNLAAWPDSFTPSEPEYIVEEALSFTGQADAAAHLSGWLNARIAYLDTRFAEEAEVQAAGKVFNVSDGVITGLTDYGKTLENIKIPAYVGGQKITAIADNAFAGHINLKTVTMQNSIVSIGNSAFSGCSTLESIKLSTKLTSIGTNAFSGCGELMSIRLYGYVSSVGAYAFEDCNNLTVLFPTAQQSENWDENWNISNCQVEYTSFTVIFSMNFTDGGIFRSLVTVELSNSVSRPIIINPVRPAPQRDGYTFDDWYADPDCTTLYNFSNPITGDTVIYAGWTPVM